MVVGGDVGVCRGFGVIVVVDVPAEVVARVCIILLLPFFII